MASQVTLPHVYTYKQDGHDIALWCEEGTAEYAFRIDGGKCQFFGSSDARDEALEAALNPYSDIMTAFEKWMEREVYYVQNTIGKRDWYNVGWELAALKSDFAEAFTNLLPLLFA